MKKDIKVITRHTPSNYGSLLQSIATIITIEKLGHDCQIIDYRRKDERGLKAIMAAIRSKKEWNNNFFKKVLYIIIRFPMEYLAQCKFDHMRSKYLKLTKQYNTIHQLTELRADIFMTGSDQVWGPVLSKNYDEAYFLSFANKESKKIAYAASFGRANFDNITVNKYKQLLSKYDNITVREDNAIELLKAWDIPCAGQVLDPTLLLSDEWYQFISKDISYKYVLIYQLHNNNDLKKYAKEFATKVGLPLIRISPSFHQLLWGGKFVYMPNLGSFLSYIKNCTYFITDSFHGTAFAINFNKQFIEILPNNKTGSRNLSILQLTNLTNRIVTNFSDFSIKDKKIDYSIINKIIEDKREKSIHLLYKIIEE